MSDFLLIYFVSAVLFSNCLRHGKQLLLVPTSQDSLTDKMQIGKMSSESSALIKELSNVVIVVGYKKKDDWYLLKDAGVV